jgi:hypothetical protein
MSTSEKATEVIEVLRAAEREPPQVALPLLNGLVGLIRGAAEQPLEVEEARANAFIAICEVAKALHRGEPADKLWPAAIGAAERWLWLDRSSRAP